MVCTSVTTAGSREAVLHEPIAYKQHLTSGPGDVAGVRAANWPVGARHTTQQRWSVAEWWGRWGRGAIRALVRHSVFGNEGMPEGV